MLNHIFINSIYLIRWLNSKEKNGISFEAKTVGISAKTTVIKPRQRNPYQLEIKFAMGLTRQIFSKIDLEHGKNDAILTKIIFPKWTYLKLGLLTTDYLSRHYRRKVKFEFFSTQN